MNTERLELVSHPLGTIGGDLRRDSDLGRLDVLGVDGGRERAWVGYGQELPSFLVDGAACSDIDEDSGENEDPIFSWSASVVLRVVNSIYIPMYVPDRCVEGGNTEDMPFCADPAP